MRKITDPFPEICADYALQFDMASDNSDVELVRKLLGEVEAFLENHSDAVHAPLYYYLGTSYGNLRTHGYSLSGTTDPTFLSSEEMDNSLEREIYCLRLQVYTNYANALETCGRKVATMKYYRNVLSIAPS